MARKKSNSKFAKAARTCRKSAGKRGFWACVKNKLK